MTTEKIQEFKKYLVMERNYTEKRATAMAHAAGEFVKFCELEENIAHIPLDITEAVEAFVKSIDAK